MVADSNSRNKAVLLCLSLTALLFTSQAEAAETPVTIFLYRVLGTNDILDLTDEDCSRFNNTPVGEEKAFSIGEIELKRELWQVRGHEVGLA